MDKQIFVHILKEKAAKVIGVGLMLFFFGAGFFFMFKAFISRYHPLLHVYFLFCGMACGIVATCLFIRIYLLAIGSCFANFFLSPKSYLKEAALLLTPIQAMIAAGKYKEAEEALLPLHEQHPGDPEVTVILMELYSDHCHDLYCAARTAELYFKHSVRRTNELHIHILMEYADLLMQCGNTGRLLELYQNQLKHGHLTPSEKKAVTIRLSNMQS